MLSDTRVTPDAESRVEAIMRAPPSQVGLKVLDETTHASSGAGAMRPVSNKAKTKTPDQTPLLILADHPRARPVGLDLQFREIYENWFEDVVKWLYALGMPPSDNEDLAQEIFLVVRRNLHRFDGGNLPGWLYRITQLTVRDHRRRAWFKNLVLRRQDVDLAELPHAAEGPARAYETAERRRLFQSFIARMSEKRRTTLVLFEIEGYSGEEIAQIQDVSLGTVWTRLHHARKDFWKLVKEQQLREGQEGHEGQPRHQGEGEDERAGRAGMKGKQR